MITNKRITILEVAKECGVSKTTVGDALNPRTSFKVAAETKKRIDSAVARLGYVPNRSAKALSSRKTYVIGIMLPEPGNSFFGNIILNLQKSLAEKGYTAFFVFWNSFDDIKSINKARRTLISHGVDGIISGPLPEVHLKKCPVPVVIWQNNSQEFDSVSSMNDIKDEYIRLVRILNKKEVKRFSTIIPVPDQGRTPDILEALKEEGVPLKREYMEYANSRKTAQEAMEKLLLLKKRPEVVLCNNDMIAISAMSTAIKSGIKVPDEMKFVGFDGTDEAEFAYPSLTTFEEPVEETIDKLLELLFRRIENTAAKLMHISIKPKLIIRDSI
jgi:DNA-binding LacI/PurR family transcriptional regulator